MWHSLGRRSELGRWAHWDKASGQYIWSSGGLARYREDHRQLEQCSDFRAGKECLLRGAENSWWNWDSGSRCHFWRWPVEVREVVRDRQAPWVTGDLPRFMDPQ